MRLSEESAPEITRHLRTLIPASATPTCNPRVQPPASLTPTCNPRAQPPVATTPTRTQTHSPASAITDHWLLSEPVKVEDLRIEVLGDLLHVRLKHYFQLTASTTLNFFGGACALLLLP